MESQQEDYQILLSYKIEGLTERISKYICNKYSLNILAEMFIEDKDNLLLSLMDIEGVTEDLAEKILYFIEVNLTELSDSNPNEPIDVDSINWEAKGDIKNSSVIIIKSGIPIASIMQEQVIHGLEYCSGSRLKEELRLSYSDILNDLGIK